MVQFRHVLNYSGFGLDNFWIIQVWFRQVLEYSWFSLDSFWCIHGLVQAGFRVFRVWFRSFLEYSWFGLDRFWSIQGLVQTGFGLFRGWFGQFSLYFLILCTKPNKIQILPMVEVIYGAEYPLKKTCLFNFCYKFYVTIVLSAFRPSFRENSAFSHSQPHQERLLLHRNMFVCMYRIVFSYKKIYNHKKNKDF